jgi:hypothetical protein
VFPFFVFLPFCFFFVFLFLFLLEVSWSFHSLSGFKLASIRVEFLFLPVSWQRLSVLVNVGH